MLLFPFADGDGFDAVEAYGYALAAKLLRRDEKFIRKTVDEDWGIPELSFIEHGILRLIVAQNDDVRFLIFGGAMDYRNWYALTEENRARPPTSAIHPAMKAILEPFIEMAPRLLTDAGGRQLRVAGHGIGGAAAVLFAHQVGTDFDGKVITLGAPGMFNRKAVEQGYAAHVAARTVRIINDNDLIARLPPGFEGIGSLAFVDKYGRYQPEWPEDAPPSVDHDEYELLRADVARVIEANPAAGPGGGEPADLYVTLQSLLPDVRAHELDSYLTALRRLGGDKVDQYRRVSGTSGQTADAVIEFEMQVAEEETPPIAMAAGIEVDGEEPIPPTRVPVLIELNSPGWEPPEGVKVHTKTPFFATSSVTPAELALVRQSPGVSYVSLSRHGGVPELTEALPFVHADDGQFVLDGTNQIAERGDSAVFAMIDTGIDILHDAFKDANGNSRIIGVWDQRAASGPSPKETSSKFTQDYGKLYTGQAIAAFLGLGELAVTMTPPALRNPPHVGNIGHGTHVASIGAGREFGNVGRGMAPDAKILVVIPHMMFDPNEGEDPKSLGYSVSHVDALDFIQRVCAGSNPILDKAHPVAVNISLGMNAGAHDGKSLFETAVDATTGSGRNRGMVIVKSAGNEGNTGHHTRIRPELGETRSIKWVSSSASRRRDYIEAWYESRDELTFSLSCPPHVRTDRGGKVPPVQIDKDNPSAIVDLAGNKVLIRLDLYHRDNGDSLLAIDIVRGARPIHSGTWTLKVTANKLSSVDKVLDVWIDRMPRRALAFMEPDPACTISVPGTAQTVVTVGACERPDCTPAHYSSSGPTRSRGAKPEVCAPGSGIVAARSNAGPTASVASSGTSMAAPLVTGLLLLAMSHRAKQAGTRQFSAEQLRARLSTTTRDDQPHHDPSLGFGLIDATKFFEAIVRWP